jgi:hypothetical protein
MKIIWSANGSSVDVRINNSFHTHWDSQSSFGVVDYTAPAPSTYHINVFELGEVGDGDDYLCSTTFTCVPSFILPESSIGALSSLIACFIAVGLFEVYKVIHAKISKA